MRWCVLWLLGINFHTLCGSNLITHIWGRSSPKAIYDDEGYVNKIRLECDPIPPYNICLDKCRGEVQKYAIKKNTALEEDDRKGLEGCFERCKEAWLLKPQPGCLNEFGQIVQGRPYKMALESRIDLINPHDREKYFLATRPKPVITFVTTTTTPIPEAITTTTTTTTTTVAPIIEEILTTTTTAVPVRENDSLIYHIPAMFRAEPHGEEVPRISGNPYAADYVPITKDLHDPKDKKEQEFDDMYGNGWFFDITRTRRNKRIATTSWWATQTKTPPPSTDNEHDHDNEEDTGKDTPDTEPDKKQSQGFFARFFTRPNPEGAVEDVPDLSTNDTTGEDSPTPLALTPSESQGSSKPSESQDTEEKEVSVEKLSTSASGSEEGLDEKVVGEPFWINILEKLHIREKPLPPVRRTLVEEIKRTGLWGRISSIGQSEHIEDKKGGIFSRLLRGVEKDAKVESSDIEKKVEILVEGAEVIAEGIMEYLISRWRMLLVIVFGIFMAIVMAVVATKRVQVPSSDDSGYEQLRFDPHPYYDSRDVANGHPDVTHPDATDNTWGHNTEDTPPFDNQQYMHANQQNQPSYANSPTSPYAPSPYHPSLNQNNSHNPYAAQYGQPGYH